MTSTAIPLAFLLSTDAPTADRFGSLAYWHIRARLMTVEDGAPRGISGYSFEGTLGLEALEVSAQNDVDHARDGQTSYAWKVEYRDIYSADSARVQAMAATMRRIDAKLAKLEATLGYVETYGAFLARVAIALDVQTFIVQTVRGSDGFYASGEYRTMGPREAIAYVSREESAFIARHAPATVEA